MTRGQSSRSRYYLTCLTLGRVVGRKAPRTETQIRSKVERGELSSKEAATFASSMRRRQLSQDDDWTNNGGGATARSEGNICSPARRERGCCLSKRVWLLVVDSAGRTGKWGYVVRGWYA